jgi:hypothetical protein
MNAENAEIALLSDDELNAVAVGECGRRSNARLGI